MEETFRERWIWIDDVGRASWHGGERTGGGRDGRSGRGRGAISSRAIDNETLARQTITGDPPPTRRGASLSRARREGRR